MDYPEEWNQLSRHERRKKIRVLRRERGRKSRLFKNVSFVGLAVVIGVGVFFGYRELTKKSPEQVVLGEQIEEVSLEGKVEEFPIEGREHVPAGTDVGYQTNPPSSGAHLGQAERWGIYDEEIDDLAAVHGLEHGGIWITYKEIDEETIKVLEEIGRANSQSTIVSPREANDSKIVVAAWGRMMKLETADRALIQKYIDTYKNQAPERLAR